MAASHPRNVVRIQAIPLAAPVQLAPACFIAKPMTVAQQLRQQKALRDGTNDPLPTQNSVLRCKRRIDFVPGDRSRFLGGTVAKRNERERNRVKQVNMGFAALREHVPNGRENKKMSKVETLRNAMTYIKQLQDILSDDVTAHTNFTVGQDENNENDVSHSVFQTSPSQSQENRSPCHSLGSDSETLSPEEEELLDFVSWF